MTGQLAFVESPVQLLNVLEWAHTRASATAAPSAAPAGPDGPAEAVPAGAATAAPGSADAGASARAPRSTNATQGAALPAPALTVVVLSPTDPMSRGQLRRMAQLDRKSVV